MDTEEDAGSSDNEDESLINAGVKKRVIVSGPVRSVDELTELRNRVPYADLTVLFFTWVGLVLFSMAKGGHGSASVIGLSCGGYVYLCVAYTPILAMSLPTSSILIFQQQKLLLVTKQIRVLASDCDLVPILRRLDAVLWRQDRALPHTAPGRGLPVPQRRRGLGS